MKETLLCPHCSTANGMDDTLGYIKDVLGNLKPVTQPTVLREVVGRERDLYVLSCGHRVTALIMTSNQEVLNVNGQEVRGEFPALKIRK